MITMTLTHEEARNIAKLVHTQHCTAKRYVRAYKLSASEKRHYTKIRDKAGRLENKLAAFGI